MSETDADPDRVPHDLPPWKLPLRYLNGVGPHRAELLKKLGLETVRDLLWYVPRDLLDLSQLSTVSQLTDDRIHTLKGQVVDADSRSISGGRTMTGAVLRVEDGLVRGTWFNQPWMLRRLMSEQWVLWSGKPKFREGRWELNNPRLQWLDIDEEDAQGEVLPKYGLTEGLTLESLRAVIRQALEHVEGTIEEHLPDKFRDRHKLPELGLALRQLHQPGTTEEFAAARRRLVFDEQLDFQLGLALRRRVRTNKEQAPAIVVTPKIDARIRRLFDFEFTAGQNQAIEEIVQDLTKSCPMHRLLQADVGAGKTVIALYAMLSVVAAGYQAVMMAPTELLARQHWRTLQQVLWQSPLQRTLLTGTLTSAQRRENLQKIEAGQLQLIVGTQAVIQQDVRYRNLGLAVIDEQHKFGVAQRAHFTGQEVDPHVLVMTATPIPRSLCLTQYGDLDLSIMTDLPPGRQTVVTSRVMTKKVARKAWSFVKEKLNAGRQAYVICPHVDSPDPDAPAGAVQIHQQLQAGFLSDYRVGIVHGQQDREQQQQVMTAFRDQEVDVLVATTVVEVGVDVPNATLMVVMDAHQFGLSQLHQLRGRIGRGKFQGYCFLFSEMEREESQERLIAMERTSSGFEIAEADFALRGPGDVMGTAQSGNLPFRITNFARDEKILKQTRKAAEKLVTSGAIDQTEFATLKQRVVKRFGKQLNLPRTG